MGTAEVAAAARLYGGNHMVCLLSFAFLCVLILCNFENTVGFFDALK